MASYMKPAYCTYDIKYQIVWITKYPKSVFMGKIAIRIKNDIENMSDE